MNEVYQLFNKLNIKYYHIEHEAVCNVVEAKKIEDKINGIGCKNLFLKNKKNYYLYMIEENKKADLKKLAEYLQCGRLSFAGEEELYELLKLKPGSVTPLGIINDCARVTLIFDKSLQQKRILVHPNKNTATVSLLYEDLIKIVKYMGNKYFEV